MKYCLLKLTFIALLFNIGGANGQTYKETRNVLFTANNEKKIYQLDPEKSISFDASFGMFDYPTKKQLRVVGGIKMPVPFSGRGEEMFRRSEYLIDDNLDSVNVMSDRYSLSFKGEYNNYERHAYYRITGELFHGGEITLTANVKRSKLTIGKGGDFGIAIELFYKKDGRHKDDIYDAPDSVIYMPIGEGSSNFELISQNFILPDHVACLFLRVGGTNFGGQCHLEAPSILQDGKTAWKVPFVKHAQRNEEYNYWIGCNLSTRSMPRWRLAYNDKTIFEGNIFDRASNIADFYIPLPAWVKKEGKLTLTLLKEQDRVAYPYEIRRIELIEESARDLEIVAVPRYVAEGDVFGVLIETNKSNIKSVVTGSNSLKPLQEKPVFKSKGLHVVQFEALENGTDLKACIGDVTFTVPHIITRKADSVYLSVGDDMYVDKEYQPYDYFFKWYISQRVGNWYQFRPSYQWSGVRVTDPEVIRHYTTLLNKMQIPYAWQVEGRTLGGKQINPSAEALHSPMFRGKQAHENDGGYYYWQHFLYQGVFSDMAARNRPYGGIFAKHRPIYTDHGVFIHYDPSGVKDMADGATKLVENLAYSRGGLSSRHTGPSTMFRYLYQAGYQWLGAEQMYGPEEIIMSALRGASRAYGKTNYGSLHAMQWGSAPFTDPKHAMRFYMSLSVAYMHGSSHINTEDALWTDEYANDRYSESGKLHIDAQHRVLDYIETHSRRGEMRSNIAVIQGRNDAWKSFIRGNIWSQTGDKWKFNRATESFDLLKIFYPNNTVDACGPNGWFTSTPYGTVDILPIEAPLQVMNKYKMMLFLGWNSYNADDFKRIENFVRDGGTLILTAAHLNSERQPHLSAKLPSDDTQIRHLLGDNYQSLKEKSEIQLGRGKIIYFPQNVYPIEKDIVEEYSAVLKTEAAATLKGESERGWIKPAPKVGFSVWDSSLWRTIYLLNIDWQSSTFSQKAELLLGNKSFEIDVRQNQMETIFCIDKMAIMPESNTTDLIEVRKAIDGNPLTVILQTTGADKITVFDQNNKRVITTKAAGLIEIKKEN